MCINCMRDIVTVEENLIFKNGVHVLVNGVNVLMFSW